VAGLSNADENILISRREKCVKIIRQMQRAIVAFSAGVDSTFLLALCCKTLGSENVLAAVGISHSLPQRELNEARKIAKDIGVELMEVVTNELSDDEYVANTPRRCYHCKRHLFKLLQELAAARGFDFILSGANADDVGDYRPGMQAAAEYGVQSPLLDAGLTKSDIRELSRRMGLPTWDKPAMACLASRVQYGNEITAEKLTNIEKAENFLKDLGFSHVRVRHHGTLARIEVPKADFQQLLSNAAIITEYITKSGFVYVTFDLAGFRSGSSNEVLFAGEATEENR